jgi:polar amino acid transport system substrate-binding protein
MIKKILYLQFILGLLLCIEQKVSFAADNKTIDVYSYYTTPPFHFAETKTGLVKEIMDAIDDASEHVSFSFHIVSRPKLTALLESESNTFIVPFAHPIWFKDKERTKYFWSRPLFSDHNALISNVADPIEFKGLYTFIFQKVGVPKGYQIYLLDDLVEKNKAERVDVSTIPSLINLVQRESIKMAVIPYALARYHVDKEHLTPFIYFSKRPHQTYDRHLMLVNADKTLNTFIDEAIQKIKEDGTLERILNKYGY